MTEAHLVRVGFVGAGQMGEPMVRRLLGAGFPVTVFARRPEVKARLAAAGAALAGTVGGAAAGADVLVLCLFDGAQLLEVALGDEGAVRSLGADAVVVNHTTLSPSALRALVNAAGSARVVDAPVSGSATDIDEGRLRVLVGAEPAAFARAEPALRTYGDPLLPTGEVGSATLVKLVNNALFAAHAQVASDALRLADDLGIDRALLLGALAVCSGGSNVLHYRQAQPDDDGSRAVPYIRKDVAACREAARELGVTLGYLEEVIASGPLPFT
ncbi:MAG TPA: NAD(P)-dependent oxidoreductase [Acidimicrobiales bacterium]|nr:NAD(P)-dependent oxidoreductase [Acidimicrobiales bacterium]